MNNFSFEIDLANIRTLEYLINVQEAIDMQDMIRLCRLDLFVN